jgi:gluconate 5-dehydrogenase
MIKELFDISGKTILITGASQGLGFVFARGLGLSGAKIIINGRNQDKLNSSAEELRLQGIEVMTSAFDVQNESEINNAVKTLPEIDVLINNAGIQIRNNLEEYSSEDWDKIIDVNLKGAFLVSKALIKQMISRLSGKIINICSVQSELGRQSITPYAASKGGIKMLTKGMATEWGKYNIQVNGIGPGYFKTEMTKSLVEDEKFNKWLCSRTPANRWGDPLELIGAAIFLSSKASDYVNGQILYVDGGMLACV